MQQPILTISLDFELLWGIFDKMGSKISRSYFVNTRAVVPRMLEQFVADEVAVTWATVGMLFAKNQEEWLHYQPLNKPSYREKQYSAYEWTKANGLDKDFHFAPELISQVIQAPRQELGSHTYAHYYTLMRGQNPEQFRMDLRAAQNIASDKFNVRMSSLVFPRNHLNLQYLDICMEEGFSQVRGNPQNWFWQETQHQSLLKRISRTGDCFIPLGQKTSYKLDEVVQGEENGPYIIPASRLLRPHFNKKSLVNGLRLHRILREMTYAAKNNEVYHLWWHPHNFGNYPEASMQELKRILLHFKKLQAAYGMQSFSMAQVAALKKGPVIAPSGA